MMEHIKEELQNGTPVFTNAGHPITTDALLLAGFCTVRRDDSVCDLGSGSGILLLSLVDRGAGGRAVGVEQSADGVCLLQMAAEAGGLAQVQAVQADLRAYHTGNPFDLVVCNPPYYANGPRPVGTQRAATRHQQACTIGQAAQAAGRLLKDNGRFCVCWPAAGLAALFEALGATSLAPRRLQLVRPRPEKPARLALVEARKFGGEGLEILPDIF